MTHTLTELIDHLRCLFATETRPGGQQAAQALGEIDGRIPLRPNLPDVDFSPMEALFSETPLAGFAPLLSQLTWRYSGLSDGRIRPEIARNLLTCEIMGPTGMIDHPEVKVGLFYQGPHVNYVTRTHAAEETFVILGGTARWSVNGGPAREVAPGGEVHNPSMAPHYSVTGAEPTLAAWRWTGDIRFETYAMVG